LPLKKPLLPIDKIRFLINLDLMGNGEEGMMVVNGELHETEFAMLEEINLQKQLLKTIGKRGTARNSDHYWFSHNGVPAFFLYTTGGSKAYHDIYDTPQQLPMDEFDDIQTLLKDFVSKLGQ
jgi:aminopeptidase YwaD